MDVLKARFAGMCFGVRDALAATEEIRDPAAVTIFGELVHNGEVRTRLSRRGFAQVAESERERIPSTPKVLITAHGISDGQRDQLERAGKTLVDTTCPLVRDVHAAARRFRDDGRFVVILGRKGHVEVQGVTGDLTRFIVVESEADIASWGEPRIGIVCQSTLPPVASESLRAGISAANPGSDVAFADTICLPTRQRQWAVGEILDRIDALVVVGGRNSNNTLQLVTLARNHGVPAVHVETADDLSVEAFRGCRVVGLTAGTSTLDRTIDEVHAALARMTPASATIPGRPPFDPPSMHEAPPLPEVSDPTPPKSRHALLLNPFYPKAPHASFGKHVLTPSLALTSIAAATPDDWTVSYWDENLLQGPPPLDPFPEVVGITVHLTFARRAYELARWFRSHGAKVVLGGLHVTTCPDEAAANADAIALGEGVQVWPRILADAACGRLQRVYRGTFRQAYANAPSPRRDILPQRSFLTTASLIATRGCHNRCDFCYLATNGLDIPYQMRDPEDVVREFLATDEPYGVFIDNNLGSRPSYLRALCATLEPADRIWSAAVTIDVADDPALVRAMALAGCTGVFIGFESLDGANLDDAGKRSPRPADYLRRVEIFHANGIQVNGSFVLGFDHDGPDVFERTVDWIERARLECATFHILTPYPGTPLFEAMERDGRILHRNWGLYDTAHAVFRPRHMSATMLERGYAWCYRRLFSHRSIWRRRPQRFAELPGYLAMSYLYKRANRVWPLLIRHQLTHAVWRPLVEAARRRHLRFRRVLRAAHSGSCERRTLHTGVASVPTIS